MIVATAGTVASPSTQCVVATSRNVSSSAFNIYAYLTPAASGTGSQTATTVAATVAVFTNLHEGGTILFSGGQICIIQSTSGTVGSPSTTCVVTPSQSVSSSSFTIFTSAAQSPRTALARALTKKTKAASIPAGTSFVWNATRQQFEPRSAEPAPVLFMNVRNSGTNATLQNSSALQRMNGRNTGGSLIAAGTVIPNSQLDFEWRGNMSVATGNLMIGISLQELFGIPSLSSVIVFVPTFSSAIIIIRGSFRFSGPQNAMTATGLGSIETIQSAGTGSTRTYFFGGSSGPYDMTAASPFEVIASWGTANVGNILNVETFKLQHIINAN